MFKKKELLVPAILAVIPAMLYAYSFHPPQKPMPSLVYLLYVPIDSVFLFFPHELGHWISYIFTDAQFIRSLSGPFLEVVAPGACLVYLLKKDAAIITGPVMIWLGIAFMDTAYYMADAYLRIEIPEGPHDWVTILNGLGLLNHAVVIGQIVYFIGIWFMWFPMFMFAYIMVFGHRHSPEQRQAEV